MIGSSPLGSRVLGDNAEPAAKAVSNGVVSNSIAVNDAVEQLFVFDDAAQLSISVIDEIEFVFASATSIVTMSESTISEDVIGGLLVTEVGLYEYDFQLIELQVAATDVVVFRPALREFFTEVAAPFIAATSTIQQKFVFDDQLTINLGDFDVSYEFEGLTVELKTEYPMLPIAPISANAIGEVQWEGEQNFQPSLVELSIGVVDDIIKTFIRDSLGNLELTASDNQGPGVVRPADGIIEYPHFRPVLRVSATDNITLEVDFVDDPSTAYAFPSAGIDRLLREPGIPLGPITVSTISEEQYEGLMDFQPSLLELSLNETSPIEVIIDYPEDIGSLEIDADQTAVLFRPALREFFVETASISIAAQDSTYLFEYPLIYSNVSPGLPIGPITVSAIAEEQIILGSLAEIYEYSDTASLNIVVQDQIETNKLEIEIDTTAVLEIASDDIVSAAYPSINIVFVEIDSIDSIQQLFVFDDTVEFAQLIADSTVVVADYDTILFNTVNVIDIIESTHTFDDTTDLEITASAPEIISQASTGEIVVDVTDTIEQLFVFDDTVEFAQLAVDSIEFTADYDTILFNTFAIIDNIQQLFVFDNTGELEVDVGSPEIIGETSTGELSITVDATVNQVFVFDDTAEFVQLIADSNEITADYDTVLFNVFDVSDSIEQLFVFDDTAQFIKLSVADIEVTQALENVTAFTILASDIITTILTADDNLTIELGTDDNINQLFVFDDTAQFVQLVADSIEFTADYDTVLFNSFAAIDSIESTQTFIDAVDLEITVSSPEIISEASTSALEVAAIDAIQQQFVYDDTVDFVQLGADSFEITADYDTVLFNSFAATDAIEQQFVYNETAQFIKLSVAEIEVTKVLENVTAFIISANDTTTTVLTNSDSAELEIAASEILNLSEGSVGSLDINVQADIEKLTGVVSVTSISINSTASIEQQFVYDDTVNFVQLNADSVEISLDYDTVLFNSFAATDAIEQQFVYNETAQFVQLGIDSIEVIRDYDTVLFNTFAATDAIESTQTFDDNIDLEISASSPEIISESSTGSLELASIDTVEQLFVFDDTADFVTLDASSFEITADYDTILFNVVNAVDTIEQLFVFDDTAQFIKFSVADIEITQVIETISAFSIAISDSVTVTLTNSDNAALEIAASEILNLSEGSVGNLEINAVAGIEKLTDITSIAPVTINASANIEQLFIFDDTVDFIQLNADGIEISLDYDTILFNSFAGQDSIEQLFVFDDTAQFVQLGAESITIVRDYDTVILNSFGVNDSVESTLNFNDTTDLLIAAFAPEIISEASVGELDIEAESSITQLFVFDDTAQFVKISTESIEFTVNYDTLLINTFAVTDNIEQLFVFDDTAEFTNIVAQSIEIIRDYDTVIFPEISATDNITARYSYATITDLDVSVVQAIGITEVSSGSLLVSSASTENIAYTYDDSVDFVKLAATSEEVSYTSDTTLELEIDAVSVESISYVFDDTVQFVNLIAASTQVVRDYDTLLINSFDVETVTSSTLNRTATVQLDLESPTNVSIRYNIPLATLTTELDAVESVAATYNFDDTAEFAKIVIEDIDYVAVYDTITAGTIEASDIVTKVVNVTSQAELELNDLAVQSFTYVFDDVGSFVKLGVTSTEIAVNIENEGNLEFGITDEVTFVYAISSSPFVEIETVDDISKTVSDKSVGYIEFDANTFAQGYTLFQQIYANDTIGLNLEGLGDGLKITGAQQVSRQIWIG